MDFGPNPRLDELTTAPKLIRSTFHPFPKLPEELRLAIWELCLPPPRRVFFYYGTARETKQHRKMPSPPITLWVSQESRFLSLRRYTLTTVASVDQRLYRPQYVALSTDIFDTNTLTTVVLRTSWKHPTITSDLAQIHRMVIDSNTVTIGDRHYRYPIDQTLLNSVVKGALPGLREIKVVVHGPRENSRHRTSNGMLPEDLERFFQGEEKESERVVEWVRSELEKEGVRWNEPRLIVKKCRWYEESRRCGYDEWD